MPIDIKTDNQTGPGAIYYSRKVHFTAAEILTLGLSNLEVVPSPGPGKAIDLIGVVARINFGTIAFNFTQPYLSISATSQAGNGAIMEVAQSPIGAGPNFLASTETTIGRFIFDSFYNCLVADDGLSLWASGNDGTGDSTMDVYVAYRIVTL